MMKVLLHTLRGNNEGPARNYACIWPESFLPSGPILCVEEGKIPSPRRRQVSEGLRDKENIFLDNQGTR